MTIHYNVDSLREICLSDTYLSDKHIYQTEHVKVVSQLVSFLDSIEINKNYYKTGIQVKNPKFKKRVSDDTIIIKNFKASLNKMSSMNYKQLCSHILRDVSSKRHLYPLLLQYIFEQSLLHHTYCAYYAELVDQLNNVFKDLSLLTKHIDMSYQSIRMDNLDTSSDYSNLCSKNKLVDQLIGYSIFISELEMRGIIQGRVDTSIESILQQLTTDLSEDELYKCVSSLAHIFNVVYKDKPIKSEYIDALEGLKGHIKYMKIKFKIMDILEKR